MSTSYNISELTRTITTLKETKLTLNFKLNLLRSSAASSLAYLSIFEGLVDRLVDVGSKIWVLEEKLKDKKAGMGEALFADGDGDEVKSALKEALALCATLDALGEEVMRLKFTMEATQTSADTATGVVIFDRELLVNSGNISNAPATKKQKFDPASQIPKAQPPSASSAPVAIKEEPEVPKKTKLSHWAPEGYYYVKAVISSLSCTIVISLII